MLAPSPLRGPGVLESERLARIPRLVHGFTTRTLGSVAATEGATESDAIDAALGGAHGWSRRGLVQVHGARALRTSAMGPSAVEADGLVTADPGELLVIRTADCLPILLAAVEDGSPIAVAALHAGWRGLVAGIVGETVRLLRESAPSASVIGAIGPSIGACCFEIGPEVAAPIEALVAGTTSPGRGDRSMGDLPLAARRQLADLGVETDAEAPPCTRCDPERFHSYRAAGRVAGRLGAFIGMAR